ncbi:hypothetical protein IWQ56_005732, partial [Coemansia nantahalensis]
VVETLLCADQFEVAGLRDSCWRSLVARIAPDTVWDIWSIAADLEAHDQQRACRAFCTRNFSELCASPATMWAPAPLLRQVLASDALNVLSEELLFETVIAWASFREDDAPRPAPTPSASSTADEAVLTCHRSPSNLALLPRSPRIARPAARRTAELTREAHTSASPSPTPGSPAAGGARQSVIAFTRLQPGELVDPQSAASASSVWSSLFERKRFLPELLPCIRFPMMDKEFLLHVVERNTELMAMPLMKDLLIEAYRFHAFNPPLPTRRSFELRATKEHAAPAPQYAKIILPLKSDDLTLSRSQRRKQIHKINVQALHFSP